MNIGIILAGGQGTRMGITSTPKQFIEVYGKPIVIHTIEAFDVHPEIDRIAVVCHNDFHDEMRIWIRKFELSKVQWIVDAGETRQKSVYNGLQAIRDQVSDDDIVVIHDSARPLISSRIISDNIKYVKQYGAVDTVIPASDTIIKSLDGVFMDSVPIRKELFIGQTPQSFYYHVIESAHRQAVDEDIQDATDDCQLIIKQGKTKVSLVQGEKMNFKITTMDDLLMLKAVLKMSKLEWI